MNTDNAREARIHHYYQRLCNTQSHAVMCAAWKLMQREILARSPKQVSQMEVERGLRCG